MQSQSDEREGSVSPRFSVQVARLVGESIEQIPSHPSQCFVTYRSTSANNRLKFEQMDCIPSLEPTALNPSSDANVEFFIIPEEWELLVPKVERSWNGGSSQKWVRDQDDGSWTWGERSWRPIAVVRVFRADTNEYVHAYERPQGFLLSYWDPNDPEHQDENHAWVQGIFQHFREHFGPGRWTSTENIALIRYINRVIAERGLINFVERFSPVTAALFINHECHRAEPKEKHRTAADVRTRIRTDEGDIKLLRERAEKLRWRRDSDEVIEEEENKIRDALILPPALMEATSQSDRNRTVS